MQMYPRSSFSHHCRIFQDPVSDLFQKSLSFQVVIVPGYGVAVSKAQYALAELVEMLSKTPGGKPGLAIEHGPFMADLH